VDATYIRQGGHHVGIVPHSSVVDVTVIQKVTDGLEDKHWHIAIHFFYIIYLENNVKL